MTATPVLATLFALLIFVAPTPGPAGEGSVAPDTLITMADGTVKKAADLAKGDSVRVWDDAHSIWISRSVKSVVRNNSRSYWVLRTPDGILRGSSNLWLAVSPARLLTMASLPSVGSVMAEGAPGPGPSQIAGIREYPANLALYNIDLESPGFLIASGLLIHD